MVKSAMACKILPEIETTTRPKELIIRARVGRIWDSVWI
jgi:hypothetical protein